MLSAAVEAGPRSPVVLKRWVAIADETANSLVDLIVTSTAIEALRDPDAARTMMVTLIWMIERNCYLHAVHGTDEDGGAALAERLSAICIRALAFQ